VSTSKKTKQRISKPTNLVLRPKLKEWASDYAKNSDRFKNLSTLVAHLLSDLKEKEERRQGGVSPLVEIERAQAAKRSETPRARAE
jgi:hypothetical protein